MNSVKIVVGIPARMGSTRFPGKPLCNILGKTMIEHCYKRCSLSKYTTSLFVAACDKEIQKGVEDFGGTVIMTDPAINRPGLRVAAAAETLGLDDDDIVVVVQGDEPLVHPKMIEIAVEPILNDHSISAVNLVKRVNYDEANNIHEVKVVFDIDYNTLFLSREPIPSKFMGDKSFPYYIQVCVFPFTYESLQDYTSLESTPSR